MKKIRLWVRQDGQQPKALARDATAAPGPGRIVDVHAASADAARDTYATATGPVPDEDKTPQAWLEHRQALKRVQEVTRGPG